MRRIPTQPTPKKLSVTAPDLIFWIKCFQLRYDCFLIVTMMMPLLLRFLLVAVLFASFICHGMVACAPPAEVKTVARTLGITEDRAFSSRFGCTHNVATLLWNLLLYRLSPDTRIKHLLWALMFLKSYVKEALLCAVAKVSRATYRKWVWRVVRGIANLRYSVVRTPLSPCCSLAPLFNLTYSSACCQHRFRFQIAFDGTVDAHAR